MFSEAFVCPQRGRLCPGGSLSRMGGSLSRMGGGLCPGGGRSLSRWVGGLCPGGGSLSRGGLSRSTPPFTVEERVVRILLD